MKAYSQGISKAQFLAEIAKHQEMDNFIQGTYGNDEGKGCAVGCSIMSINKLTGQSIAPDSHDSYEDNIGVPEWLAELEDVLFEGLPLERAKLWPYQFSEAIPEGAELDKLKVPFICHVLEHNIATMKTLLETVHSEEVVKHIKAVIAVNEQMIAAQLSGDEVEIETASDAAWAAWDTSEAASWAARAASEAARAASRAASESTSGAARSAEAASAAASGAARAAEAASGAASEAAARAVSYTKFADKLLELLRSCD